eukprot:TRINITY_DN7520_c0_g7_i1.p1 TRINITY_DN7520_c0_g7~~TRINITY_DN7520_c0_g7_i1.p1  ORF type:complete len:282 (+),score=-10.22 TRINITY_DN7520_c0_g7_i1:326-1171(+)
MLIYTCEYLQHNNTFPLYQSLVIFHLVFRSFLTCYFFVILQPQCAHSAKKKFVNDTTCQTALQMNQNSPELKISIWIVTLELIIFQHLAYVREVLSKQQMVQTFQEEILGTLYLLQLTLSKFERRPQKYKLRKDNSKNYKTIVLQVANYNLQILRKLIQKFRKYYDPFKQKVHNLLKQQRLPESIKLDFKRSYIFLNVRAMKLVKSNTKKRVNWCKFFPMNIMKTLYKSIKLGSHMFGHFNSFGLASSHDSVLIATEYYSYGFSTKNDGQLFHSFQLVQFP